VTCQDYAKSILSLATKTSHPMVKDQEIKSRFVKGYLPHYPKTIPPSGSTTEEELLDISCRKNCFVAKQKIKLAKDGKGPESFDMANYKPGKTPINFWAFRKLHGHYKLSPPPTRTASDDPIDKENRVKKRTVVSQRDQRALERNNE
jgi:hypothetical protein